LGKILGKDPTTIEGANGYLYLLRKFRRKGSQQQYEVIVTFDI